MAKIFQLPVAIPATNGNFPNLKFCVVGDDLSTITTPGYFSSTNLEGFPLVNNDILMMLYSYNQNTNSGTFAIITVAISNTGVISLSQWSSSSGGGVVLPTIANHIATYTNTTGTISEDAATAINAGNIQAGLSGTAGHLTSFPATAGNGNLNLTGVAAGGAFNTTISNGTMGQSTTYTIPDAGNAAGRFLVGATATPFVSGNIPAASGTGGLMVDSGKSAANIPTVTNPTIANHIATYTNTSGNLSEDAATAINGGNIQAGLSGTAGALSSFPGTAARGSLEIAAVANAGNTVTTLSNASMGQASVITIPDPGSGTGNVILDRTAAGHQTVFDEVSLQSGFDTSSGVLIGGNVEIQSNSSLIIDNSPTGRGQTIITGTDSTGGFSATITTANLGQSSTFTIADPVQANAGIASVVTPVVSGHLAEFSGVGGLIVDTGTSLRGNVLIPFAGGSATHVFAAAGMRSTWVVIAATVTSTNPTPILYTVPGTDTLTITWAMDPGANTVVSYLAITVAI